MIYKTNSGYGVNFNQVATRPINNRTHNGITYTVNSDGTITADGTATALSYYVITYPSRGLTAGHKYLLRGCPQNGSGSTYHLAENTNGAIDYGSGKIWVYSTSPSTSARQWVFYITNGTTVNNLTFSFQCFDLTQMFGSGNEPTTVAEFREMYPDDYYDYTLSQWQWAKKGKITSYITPVIENGTTLLPIEHHIVGLVEPELSDISLLKLKTGSYKNTNNRGPYVEVKEGNEIVINTPSTDAKYGVTYLPILSEITLKAGHTYYSFLYGQRKSGDWNVITIDCTGGGGPASYFLYADIVYTTTLETDKVIYSVRAYLNNTSTHYDNYSVKLIITENRQYLIDKGLITV